MKRHGVHQQGGENGKQIDNRYFQIPNKRLIAQKA